MTSEVGRYWDSGAARGWQLVWLAVLLVLMKLAVGFAAVNYSLTQPPDFVPRQYIVL